MDADEEGAGLPRRRTPDLPPEFGPLTPLGLNDGAQRAPRAPGEQPRLRLSSSALRRNAADRPGSAPAAPAAATPVAVPPGPRPSTQTPTQTPTPATRPAAPPAQLFSARVVTEPPVRETPEVEPPGKHGARRTGIAVGLACLLVGLVAAVLVLGPDEDGAVADRSSPKGGVPTAAGEFGAPVAVALDSEYIRTEVLEDGELLVTHWISAGLPVDRMRLRPPSSPGLDDGQVGVEQLTVAADGVRLDAARIDDLRSGAATALPDASELYVSYHLTGAVDLSGSATGRALATVTSLEVGVAGRSLARIQVFPGGRVLTLACLAAGAGAIPRSCGAQEEDAWKVESPAGEAPATVIAQFDLAITH